MGASAPEDDSATDRVEPDAVGAAEGTDRVDVVLFPDDDDHIVVAAGDGDRAVAYHRYGKYGFLALSVLFASLGVAIVYGFLTAETALAWPLPAVLVGAGVLVLVAYVRRRYDPETPTEVVARDVTVEEAGENYDVED